MVNDETGYKIEFNFQHTLERGFPHVCYVSDVFYYYSDFTLCSVYKFLQRKTLSFGKETENGLKHFLSILRAFLSLQKGIRLIE